MTVTQSPQEWLAQEWAAGRNPSGAELGRKFGKTTRRGQQIIAEERRRRGGVLDSPKAKPAKPRGYKYTAKPARGWGEPPKTEPPTSVLGLDRLNGAIPADPPKRDHTRAWTIVAVAVVALAAAVISFAHQWHLAREAGEAWRAWLLPVSVDGLIAAAALTMTRTTGSTRRLATWALAAGIAVSVAANIASAWPTPLSMIVAAWPPVALFVAYELLIQQIRPPKGN